VAEISLDTIEKMDVPWAGERPSIHSLVVEALGKRGERQEELRIALPNGEDEDSLQWAPGALDSLVGAPDRSQREAKPRKLVAALGAVLRRPSKESAEHLYSVLCEQETISIIDSTIERVSRELADHQHALAALARRLICEAPDVEPVKAGVALLGISGERMEDAELVSTIGCFEEITLYSVVALRHLLTEPDEAVWRLARNVHGWGRIQAVERLIDTQDPVIKDWLLREGFRNTIMYEYLAYACAVAGGLYDVLAGGDPDDEVLVAAGEILTALIIGGPAQGMEDYEDGAGACVAYLRRLAGRPIKDLSAVHAVVRIKSLAEEERAERLRARRAWGAQTFFDIRAHSNDILRRADVRTLIDEGLSSSDDYTFNGAADLAAHFSIDSWPLRLARQKSRTSDQWYWLMQAQDGDRIDQVLALAREQLNLALIGSGPTDSLGLGPDFRDDLALDFVLQDMDRFPGKGWDLVKVGLRGRTIRLRHMAVKALRSWGRAAWPADAMAELEAAAEREPEDEVRKDLQELIEGR
jgi:hypothetical protein